jgi:hypothetical protein
MELRAVVVALSLFEGSRWSVEGRISMIVMGMFLGLFLYRSEIEFLLGEPRYLLLFKD